jgi:F-type H+-transporting ATPase subunit b
MFRVRFWLRQTIVAVAFIATALPSFAADKAHDEAEAAHAKPKYKAEVHEGKKEVTKDFDLSKPEDEKALLEAIQHGHVAELRKDEPPSLQKLFSLSADLGLWSLVVFLALLFVLSKIAWPKMLAGLQNREDRIRGALDEAQKTKEEAQALRLQLQKDMDAAQDRANKVIEDARKAGQTAADEVAAKARTEIQAERDRLQREIEMQTNQAIQRIWNMAAELATMAASKALGQGINESGHRKLIDDALSEIKASAPGANGHA